jgi:hypothetical protein
MEYAAIHHREAIAARQVRGNLHCSCPTMKSARWLFHYYFALSVVWAFGWAESAVLGDTIVDLRENDFLVPSFTIAELKSGSRANDLLNVLTTTGLFSVVVETEKDKSDLSTVRQTAFSGLCECLPNGPKILTRVPGVDAALLADGTTRTTLATATVGTTPLSLPFKELQEAGCGAATLQAMDTLRDQVAWVSHTFQQALDKVILNQIKKEDHDGALLERTDGKTFMTLSSIVKAAQNLEHFHVYKKSSESLGSTPSLDIHTDAGLYLAFVPGMSCDTVHQDDSNDFFVRATDGLLHRARFPQGSVGIMMGAGAENWLRLPPTLSLRATRHAVSMNAGNTRAWYGMSKYCRIGLKC